MLSKTDQAIHRGSMFRHLDGLVCAPAAFALHKAGVLNYILDKGNCDLTELTQEFKANEGYLNVGLRIMASQGWLVQEVDNKLDKVFYSVNEKSELAFKYISWYEEAVHLIKFSGKYHSRKFEIEPFRVLKALFDSFKKEDEVVFVGSDLEAQIRNQVLRHIEGVIVGPTIVRLGMNGMFHKYFMEASFKPEEFHKDPENFRTLLDIFVYFGWFKKRNDTFQFTDKGLFFARRASAYGVTVSYLPTMRKLDELIFGNAVAAKSLATQSEEGHVDREMNVWGSGGAHSTYFKIIDEVIVELFNKPINEQPKGILDMGCGNGAFLQHLYNVIEQQTVRGKMLDEHPLILVGVDYNETALKITKANLIQADIWAKVIWGDIGKPDLLADDLKDNYGIDLGELLNVRTFLDHNRIWEEPKEINPNRVSKSTGAYAFEGKRISNNLVEESLLAHCKKWEPYVRKFGLLVIELHTVLPELVALNIGKTAATAYDATHGFSDQYIVEVDVFRRVMEEAGLFADEQYFRKFPNSELATVTVNLFKQ